MAFSYQPQQRLTGEQYSSVSNVPDTMGECRSVGFSGSDLTATLSDFKLPVSVPLTSHLLTCRDLKRKPATDVASCGVC